MSTCDRCGKEKHRGRCKGNGKAKAVPAPAPEPVKLKGSLEVPPGYGFRASVEDDRLVIEQDGTTPDGKASLDTVVLTRVEASRLIDWVAKLVEQPAAAEAA